MIKKPHNIMRCKIKKIILLLLTTCHLLSVTAYAISEEESTEVWRGVGTNQQYKTWYTTLDRKTTTKGRKVERNIVISNHCVLLDSYTMTRDDITKLITTIDEMTALVAKWASLEPKKRNALEIIGDISISVDRALPDSNPFAIFVPQDLVSWGILVDINSVSSKFVFVKTESINALKTALSDAIPWIDELNPTQNTKVSQPKTKPPQTQKSSPSPAPSANAD